MEHRLVDITLKNHKANKQISIKGVKFEPDCLKDTSGEEIISYKELIKEGYDNIYLETPNDKKYVQGLINSSLGYLNNFGVFLEPKSGGSKKRRHKRKSMKSRKTRRIRRRKGRRTRR